METERRQRGGGVGPVRIFQDASVGRDSDSGPPLGSFKVRHSKRSKTAKYAFSLNA